MRLVAATANRIVRREATQFSVIVTDRSALGSDEMRSDETRLESFIRPTVCRVHIVHLSIDRGSTVIL